jgi:hypothetical protein
VSPTDDERIVEAFMAPLRGLRPLTRPVPARRRHPSQLALALAAVTILAIAVAAVLVRRPEPPARPVPAITPPTGTVQPAEITITNTGIARRDLASGATIQLVLAAVSSAAFSPDGTAIGYIASTDHGCWLGIVELTTLRAHEIASCVANSTRLVTMRPMSVGDVVYRVTTLGGIAWSSDSQRIVFPCNPTTGAHADGGLCMIGRDGSRRLELGPGFAPTFSPDGQRLAFLRDPFPATGSEPVAGLTGHWLQLWVMAADGTHPRLLAGRLEDCCVRFVPTIGWAADGRSLAVTAMHHHIIDLAGGSSSKLTGDLQSDNPDVRFPPKVIRRVGN